MPHYTDCTVRTRGKAAEKWPVHGAVRQEVVVTVMVIQAVLDQALRRKFLT